MLFSGLGFAFSMWATLYFPFYELLLTYHTNNICRAPRSFMFPGCWARSWFVSTFVFKSVTNDINYLHLSSCTIVCAVSWTNKSAVSSVQVCSVWWNPVWSLRRGEEGWGGGCYYVAFRRIFWQIDSNIICFVSWSQLKWRSIVFYSTEYCVLFVNNDFIW